MQTIDQGGIHKWCPNLGEDGGSIKGLINLAMAGHQEIFKQHLIKNEEQPSFLKRYSAIFDEVSTM